MSAPHVYFSHYKDAFYLKLTGELRLSTFAAFDLFSLTEISSHAYHHVIIDLREADSLDSTALGLIARIAIIAEQENQAQSTIVYKTDVILNSLKVMRFDNIFNIVTECEFDSGELEQNATQADFKQETDKSACEHALRAHKALVELSEDNEAHFSDLIQLLETDLKQYDLSKHN